MLFWCGELVGARSRAIAVVDYFREDFVQKTIYKLGVHFEGCRLSRSAI